MTSPACDRRASARAPNDCDWRTSRAGLSSLPWCRDKVTPFVPHGGHPNPARPARHGPAAHDLTSGWFGLRGFLECPDEADRSEYAAAAKRFGGCQLGGPTYFSTIARSVSKLVPPLTR